MPTPFIRAAAEPTTLPLRPDVPSEAFAAARELLTRASYDEPTVARRLGARSLYGFTRLIDGRTTLAGPVEDANALLVRLFLDGEAVDTGLAASLVGADALDVLDALALIEPARTEGAIRATVTLYPTQGLWLASDRQPRGPDVDAPTREYVFGALNDLTRDFLRLIPDARGARVLELCAGTGVAALRAARRGARHSWATDIAPRSVHFASFNARLNDLAERVSVVRSDVWDALAGQAFDLIVGHPPYVPALAHEFDFRDAGVDGEHVTRRIVEGLPAHLAPGGRCVLRAALTARRDAPIEERVRAWLGPAGEEFDLVLIEAGEYGPMDAYRNATDGGRDFVDCERWLRQFEALGIERFAVCAVELRRDAAGRSPITERRVVGSTVDQRALDWIFRWARFAAQAGDTSEARLAGQRPRVAPGVRLAVHLQSDADAAWHTIGAAVETAWPSHVVVKAPALAPTLLELCDGTRDVGAVLGALREAGLVDENVGTSDVAHIVETLAAAGALEIAACPIPPMPTAG